MAAPPRTAAIRAAQPGSNVGRGKDDTLFALIEGFVKFENKGNKGKFISVYAEGAPELVKEAA